MLYACRSSQDLLITDDGDPVWPVRDESDEAALQAIATLFGSSVRAAPARPGESAATGVEVVLGFGAQNESNARLYAHLTRRRHLVASIEELDDVEGASVIVCQWDQLTFSALDRIHDYATTRQPIGLLVGRDAGEMRLQLLTRAAAACLRGQTDAGAVLLLPELAVEDIRLSGVRILGARANAADVTGALSVGAALLGIWAHGDGLDMRLGPADVLCGAARRTGAQADRNAPDCVAGGYCYRKRLALDVALESPSLVDPRILRCRVALVLSCFVIPALGARVRPEWSLLAAWLDSPTIGAILAPWGFSTQSSKEVIQLAREVLHSVSLADALRLFYSSDESTSGRVRLCLFGDPLTRPTPSAGAVARPQDIVRVQRPSPRVYSRPAPASLRLRRCEVLGAVLRDAECAAAPGSNIDQDAREAARLVAEVRGQRYSEASPALMMQASHAVLRFALAECNNGKDIFGNLMESPTEVPSVRPCASCGERLHVMRWPLLIDGAPARILGQCDSCGITVDDVEEGSAHLGATFNFEGGRLVLPEGLRRPGVCVGLMLRTWRRDIATWVLDADAAYGPPIGAFGPGVTTACVLAVDALEVTFLTQLIRSPW